MIEQYLSKTANMLDAVGSDAARQAAEGIDAVLYSMAAATPLLDMYEALGRAKQQLQDTYQEAAAAEQTIPNLEKYVNALVDGMSKVQGAIKRSPAYGEALNERYPPIAAEEDEGSEATVPMRQQPASEPGSPEEPAFVPEQVTQNIRVNPQLVRQMSALNKLTKVADMLDEEGYAEAAGILDTIIKDAVDLPNYPSRLETRKDLYDAPAHNNETMWEITQKEVGENRKQHHVLPMRPNAESLLTRYSPELPGVPLLHVSDSVYQDFLTKEIYNFNTGWTGREGRSYPGGSIKHQTPNLTQYAPPTRLFEKK